MEPVSSFSIGLKIINVKDTKLKGTHNQTGGVDTLPTRKQFAYQLVLSFLQALHSKGHATKISNLLLGIAKGKMSKETLVILVDLIVNQRLLAYQL
jgi:hypothetical protein